MRIKITFLLLNLLLFGRPHAQPPGGRVFKPVHYRTVIVGQELDTTLPLQKVLVLTDDHYFHFKDHTSGSCWLWIEATGIWRQQLDTLILEWKDSYWNPDSTVLITKYIFQGQILIYSDTCEENIVRNWGELKLLKEVKNFKTGLKENDDIATWVRSYAAFLECLRRFDWGKEFGKKYDTQYLLTFRRWDAREKLLKGEKWEHLSDEEIKKVLDVYDTIWEEN